MPNWCRTDIIFHGNDVELYDFYNILCNALCSKSNFVKHIQNTYNVQSKLRCSNIELTEYIQEALNSAKFGLVVETPWVPQCQIWSELIQIIGYTSVGFSYCGVETSNGVYRIYDNYGDFDLKYAVDMWLEGDDEENDLLVEFMDISDYSSDEELRIALQRLLQTKESDLNLLIGQAMNYSFADENSYITIHTYKFLDEPQ